MNHTHVKIGEIAQILSGVFVKQEADGNAAYLQVKDCLQEKSLESASRVNVRGRMSENLLHKNDILFACKGATYLCYIYDKDEPAIASTSFFIIRLRTPKILPEYIFWLLNQPHIKDNLLRTRVGIGTPVIHKKAVENVEVSLVSLEIQRLLIRISELAKEELAIRESIAEKRQKLVNLLFKKSIK